MSHCGSVLMDNVAVHSHASHMRCRRKKANYYHIPFPSIGKDRELERFERRKELECDFNWRKKRKEMKEGVAFSALLQAAKCHGLALLLTKHANN